MKFTKIIALALVLCMALPLFAACDSGTTENVRPDDGNTNDPAFASGDYQGEDFTFFTLTMSTETSEYYCGNWIDADMTGTATDDAVFKRNVLCEDKYNVKITEMKAASQGIEELTNYYRTGDYCFDVVYGWGVHLGPAVVDGLFYDFNNLQNEGYINMDNSYWYPEAREDLTIADRNFLAINEITMSKLSWTGCIFFNPQIVEDLALENPHDLVANDNWTIDKYLELVKSVHIELDGDGSFTKEDQYGVIGNNFGVYADGCGLQNTTKADDGTYTLAIGETKTIDLINKVKDVLSDGNYVMTEKQINDGADRTGYDEWEYPRSYFAKGHALFLPGTPEISREFRDMETGYGVVPMPKYDATQKDYVAGIDPCAGIFALPNTLHMDQATASWERTGTILEFLASGSGYVGSVADAYYETTIKDQRMTLEANKEMLDIVKTSGRYDWTDLVGINASNTLSEMYEKNAASSYQKSKNRLQKEIDDMYDQFLNAE